MIRFCIVFAFGVAYIAYRGVNGTTGVNIAINVIQITAMLIFAVIAIGYRLSIQLARSGIDAGSRRTGDKIRAWRNSRSIRTAIRSMQKGLRCSTTMAISPNYGALVIARGQGQGG